MIDARTATDKAIAYFKTFFPEATKVITEEVELTEDRKHWLVTVGYDSDDLAAPTQLIIGRSKKYKIFKIDVESSEILSMKIRTV
jgi:hypothetical protein